MDSMTDSRSNAMNWSQAVAVALLVLACAPGLSLEVAIGQEGATLKVHPPAGGHPPAPAPLSPPEIAAVVSSETKPQDAEAREGSEAAVGDEQTATAIASTTSSANTVSAAIEGSTAAFESEATAVSESAVAEIGAEANGELEGDSLLSDQLATAEQTATETLQDKTVELSVQPGAQAILPDDRPAWVGAKPDLSGDVHRLYVGSTAVSDESELDYALDAALVAAFAEYVHHEVLGDVESASSFRIEADYIRQNLLSEPEGHVLELNTTPAPMYEKWVALEVTPKQREQIRKWHTEALQRDRIVPLAVGLTAIIGLVGLSHLVLRRRTPLATGQPLEAASMVASPAAEGGGKRRGSVGAFLGVTLGVLLLPMLLMGLAGFFVSARRQVEVRELEPAGNRLAPAPRLTSTVEIESKSDSPTGTQTAPEREYRVQSNDQVIIIRKK